MIGLLAFIINTIRCMYKKPKTYDDIESDDAHGSYEEEKRG